MNDSSPSVVLVTGAGVSAAAGLPLYRSAGSSWSDPNFEKMSHAHRWGNYLAVLVPKWRAMALEARSCVPTMFHDEVAAAELTVITQNVDGLHSLAGTTNVLEVHGSLSVWECRRCKVKFDVTELVDSERSVRSGEDADERLTEHDDDDLSSEDVSSWACPSCGSGMVRPDMVLFGERPKRVDEALRLVRSADVVVFAGTSGNVFPVAGWCEQARRSVLVDPVPWGGFDYTFEGTANFWVQDGMPLS